MSHETGARSLSREDERERDRARFERAHSFNFFSSKTRRSIVCVSSKISTRLGAHSRPVVCFLSRSCVANFSTQGFEFNVATRFELVCDEFRSKEFRRRHGSGFQVLSGGYVEDFHHQHAHGLQLGLLRHQTHDQRRHARKTPKSKSFHTVCLSLESVQRRQRPRRGVATFQNRYVVSDQSQGPLDTTTLSRARVSIKRRTRLFSDAPYDRHRVFDRKRDE